MHCIYVHVRDDSCYARILLYAHSTCTIWGILTCIIYYNIIYYTYISMHVVVQAHKLTYSTDIGLLSLTLCVVGFKQGY